MEDWTTYKGIHYNLLGVSQSLAETGSLQRAATENYFRLEKENPGDPRHVAKGMLDYIFNQIGEGPSDGPCNCCLDRKTVDRKFIRQCQECGNKQEMRHPGSYNSDRWRDLLCKKCGSMGLDFGSFQTEEQIADNPLAEHLG